VKLLNLITAIIITVFSYSQPLQTSQPYPLLSSIKNELDVQNVSLDYGLLKSSQGVECVIPTMPILYNDVLQIPATCDNIKNNLINSRNNITKLTSVAFQLLGTPAGGTGPPLMGVINPVKLNFRELNQSQIISQLKETLGFKFLYNSKNSWELIPTNVREEILQTINAIHITAQIIKQFSEPILNQAEINSETIDYLNSLMIPWENRQLTDFSTIDAIDFADLRKLSFATRIYTQQIIRLQQLNVNNINNTLSSCIIETIYGKVGVFGKGDDSINDDYCLLLNFGGDDNYTGKIAVANSANRPVSTIIDYGGNDKYLANETGLALGVLGIGILIDLSGNDLYKSQKSGIASSLFGTSILYDAKGNDIFQSESPYSQAAAFVGVSILFDVDGDDRYYSRNSSMGFGGTLGIGIMMDNSGDDLYNHTMSPSKTNYPSFVLGTARGRWAEATDGHSLGGGYGIFIDRSGNDTYNSRSFSQGASYYFGLGVFIDEYGDDNYNSVSHSQGYSAHYGLGCFIEYSGNDKYNQVVESDKLTQIIGGGRDHSAGLFIEIVGNDIYNFGNHSAGIGDNDGIGLLWDIEGDDDYIWFKNSINSTSPSLGKSIKLNPVIKSKNSLFNNPKQFNMGLFIDNDGANSFIIN